MSERARESRRGPGQAVGPSKDPCGQADVPSPADSSSRGTAPESAYITILVEGVSVVVGRLRQWAEREGPADHTFLRDGYTVIHRAKLLSMADELEGLVPEQEGDDG